MDNSFTTSWENKSKLVTQKTNSLTIYLMRKEFIQSRAHRTGSGRIIEDLRSTQNVWSLAVTLLLVYNTSTHCGLNIAATAALGMHFWSHIYTLGGEKEEYSL